MRTKSRLTATASMLALALTLGLGASAALADDGHGGGTHPHVQMEGVADIVRAPTDLPPPLAQRGPENIRIDMKTIEVTGQLDDGTAYHYWTFDGKVPGPFVRVRVGDTVWQAEGPDTPAGTRVKVTGARDTVLIVAAD